MFVVGGAGFIGSHLVERLLIDPELETVTVYDNFSSGREWHLHPHRDDVRLKVLRGDVHNLTYLQSAMAEHDVVIHLASNPDIARAMKEPTIDFDEGTVLTQCVLEAMRLSRVRRILYASGSGVYGDIGSLEADENYGPLLPISTYGASKLAGEALISSYCHMFEFTGCVFRLGNVVGPHQTHGIGLDFVRKLLENPHELNILGDGQQSKAYVHVSDVTAAVLLAHYQAPDPFATFNVATGDYISVQEIAELVAEVVGCEPGTTKFLYSGGRRGWKGDVPIVRINTDGIRALGWQNKMSSREAIRASVASILDDCLSGRIS